MLGSLLCVCVGDGKWGKIAGGDGERCFSADTALFYAQGRRVLDNGRFSLRALADGSEGGVFFSFLFRAIVSVAVFFLWERNCIVLHARNELMGFEDVV